MFSESHISSRQRIFRIFCILHVVSEFRYGRKFLRKRIKNSKIYLWWWTLKFFFIQKFYCTIFTKKSKNAEFYRKHFILSKGNRIFLKTLFHSRTENSKISRTKWNENLKFFLVILTSISQKYPCMLHCSLHAISPQYVNIFLYWNLDPSKKGRRQRKFLAILSITIFFCSHFSDT